MTIQEQAAAAEQARKDGTVDPNAPKNPMAPLEKLKVAEPVKPNVIPEQFRVPTQPKT